MSWQPRPDDLVTALSKAAAAARPPHDRLFAREPAIALAQILSFDSALAGESFALAMERGPADAGQVIAELAARLDDWISRITRLDATRFDPLIERLNSEFDLTGQLPKLGSSSPEAVLFFARRGSTGDDPVSAFRRARTRLAQLHHEMIAAINSLKPQARIAFETRMKSGEIDPALGLLMGELSASAQLDEAINTLPSRHIRFYYQTILGQAPAPATHEQVLLHLPAPPQPVFLPAGTTLQASLPDGSQQNFLTDADVPVSQARVSALTVLTWQRDDKISLGAALGGITGMRAQHHIAGAQSPQPGRVFTANSEAPVTQGLDISTSMLALAEGERRIEMALVMRRASDLPATSDPVNPEELVTPDPNIALALSADPDLYHAFGLPSPEAAIKCIVPLVMSHARKAKKTVSMEMLYEVLARHALTALSFRTVLGRIVTLSLIEGVDWPSGDYLDEVIDAKINGLLETLRGQRINAKDARSKDEWAKTVTKKGVTLSKDKEEDAAPEEGENSLFIDAFARTETGKFLYSPRDVFEKFLGDAFSITLSTEQGPKRATVTQIVPGTPQGNGGITLHLRLAASMPAVTAPEGQAAPVLSLRMAPLARVCPVSFFERYHITQIRTRTRVDGLKTLAAFSPDGPLATDQSFLPFGPMPRDGATCILASAEMAAKPVTAIGLSLDWASLPRNGFDLHYDSYGGRSPRPNPKLTLDYLSGDGWKPITTEPLPMIETDPITGADTQNWEHHGEVLGNSTPASGPVLAAEFASRQSIRAGAVRLTLSGSADGFMAAEYPRALAAALRPRLIPLGTRPVPPAPFLPKIDRLRLTYTAEDQMALSAPDAADPGERVVQHGAFGAVEVFPKRMMRRVTLFPKRMGHGQLSIQIDGPGATGPLALMIRMADSGHQRTAPEDQPLDWIYLTPTGWADLPATALLSDSTNGLMRSGLVVIDLPDNAARNSPEMPGTGVWVAAITRQPDLDRFPVLAEVRANGLRATRVKASPSGDKQSRTWAFNPPIAHLSAPQESTTTQAVRKAETLPAFRIRMAERLRHRGRARAPWDIERLVLEAFPEVWMVNCLPHLRADQTRAAPGHVTVVILRHPLPGDAAPRPLLFDASTLDRVRRYLSRLSPAPVRFHVVNPAFEQLAVRARVRFKPNLDDGAMAERLKRRLGAYLSVWTAPPELGRFGWTLERDVLKAHISDLDYVDAITDFSILHLGADDAGEHVLLDTSQSDNRNLTRAELAALKASQTPDTSADGRTPGTLIRPLAPWSLPITAPRHSLTVMADRHEVEPLQSGIGRLGVGQMLIVNQASSPTEKHVFKTKPNAKDPSATQPPAKGDTGTRERMTP